MNDDRWWLCEPGAAAQGPYPRGELIEIAQRGGIGPRTLACPVGGSEWQPVSAALGVPALAPPPPPPGGGPAQPRSDGPEGIGFILPVSADPLIIAGSYCALLGLAIPLLGPIGLALGIIGLTRRRRYPSTANFVRILITITLGALGLGVNALLVVALLR